MGLARLEDDRFAFICILGFVTKELIAEPTLLYSERFLLEVVHMQRRSNTRLDNVFTCTSTESFSAA